MYQHIIVATDGSDIATEAMKHAVDLAKAIGAKLSAVTVTEPFEMVAFAEQASVISPTDYRNSTNAYAERVLGAAKSAAQEAGIACQTIHAENRYPYQGIIEAAETNGADLVVIGSHGRSGIEGFLLGSQAVKLLTHCKIPALVVR
jgi:nucleotide-binding universal stress UspA family protein